jgi:hypothetical protein
MREVTGCTDASRLYETTCGRHFVLPMARYGAPLASLSSAASWPEGWDIGGLIGGGADDPEILGEILKDLAASPALRVCVHPDPLAAGSWALARPKNAIEVGHCSYVLDLREGFAEIEARRFERQVRQGLRKAAAANLEIERDTSGRLVDEFHELFEKSIRRWARQQREPLLLSRWRMLRREPARKLQAIARTLGQACRIWLARLGGRPAAAIVVLQGKNAQYIRGAMDKELAGPTGANFLLQRLAIEEAAGSGCRYYHMGETRPGSPLATFKAHFGGVARPYAEYRFERAPITAVQDRLRRLVKASIGFRDI